MYWLLAAIPIVIAYACPDVVQNHKEEAERYLQYLDKQVCQGMTEQASADFTYFTNATDYNRRIMNEQNSKGGLYDAKFVRFDWASFNDSYLFRQAKYYHLFEGYVDPGILQKSNNLRSQMININGMSDNICLYRNRTVCGDEGMDAINSIFLTTRDPDELAFYWNETSKEKPLLMRPLYKPFVDLSNKISKIDGFPNSADEWASTYEVPTIKDFECVMKDVWKQIEPLYKQYYSFCRNRLRKIYGEAAVSKRGPIPIHLYNSYSGMEVGSLLNEALPYPDKPVTDVTDQLIQQNYNAYDMAALVESFIHSLGLGYLPDSFWRQSMFFRPDDRPVFCYSTSYDFHNRKDYRISMCANVNQYWLKIIAHEMGHIYSFIGSQNQTCCFQGPATVGLAEGIAETMKLFFMSYGNLKAAGLVANNSRPDPETEINDLFIMAHDSLAMMPFMLLTELWRFNIFRSNISPEKYNAAYWNLRRKYQGVVPPFPRGEEYLDAGVIAQIATNQQLICYFIQNVIMFQIHEYICTKASEYDPSNPNAKPLHHCNIYNSKIAGDILRNMYALGKSKPWTESLRIGAGKPFIDPGSLLRYFDPLYKWLVKENQRTGEFIGWE